MVRPLRRLRCCCHKAVVLWVGIVVVAIGAVAWTQSSRTSASDLLKDKALQKKVSLTFKSQPLNTVVSELGEQTGVTLVVDASFSSKKATMRVRDMTAGQVMAGLAELYGGTWVKDGNAYLMRPLPESKFEKDVRRLGDLDIGFHRRRLERRAQSKALARRIFASLTPQQAATLRSQQGLPISVLPPDVQKQLRQQVERSIAMQHLETVLLIHPRTLEQGEIRIFTQAGKGVFNGRAVTVPATGVQLMVGSRPVCPLTWVMQTTQRLR